MNDCIHKTSDGYCLIHSDGIEHREPCVEGPCGDEECASELHGEVEHGTEKTVSGLYTE